MSETIVAPRIEATAPAYTARADLSTTVQDGEAVVVDLRENAYFTLSPTATLVWVALSAGQGLSAAVDDIVSRFDVDPAQARADAEEFADTLLQQGLLVSQGA
ncbi:Hypothetical protein A7982_04937 [Minicystis rosea]|nr:Hypothetical protein A7982_04937 [Minicystis rosea]